VVCYAFVYEHFSVSVVVKFLHSIVIFGIALAVRGIRPGLYFLWIDELLTLNASADMVYQGVWTWVGNPAAWDGLRYHSPFSNYVMTLPFVLSPNPIYGRLLIAVMGALAAVVLMQMVSRYTDRSTGLMAGLLFAVFPQLVEWARFVWNPNLAPLFIVLWVYTLLLGYHEGKRRYQVWHGLWLSLSFQSQAVLVMFVPVTLLAMIGWHRQHHQRRDMLYTAFAVILISITCIPWTIGLAQYSHVGGESADLTLHVPNLESVWEQVAPVVGGVDFKFYRFDDVREQVSWLPNPISTAIQSVYVLCILAGIGLAWRKYRWWLLIFLLPFSLFFVSDAVAVSGHYLMPSAIMGVVLASMALRWIIKRHRPLGLFLFGMIWAGALWITIAHLAWMAWLGTSQYSQLTHMDTLHEQVEVWHEQAPIAFLQDQPLAVGDTFVQNLEWVMFWKLYEKPGWARLIDAGNSIPIAADGQILASFPDHPVLTDYFPDSQTIRLDQRTPMTWQYVYAHPANLPPPPIQAQGDTSFYGLMNIDGITVNKEGVILQWQGFQTSPVETYWFVLAWDDKTYEILSLPSYQWQFGDTVLTPIPIDVSETDHLILRLRRQSDGGDDALGDVDSGVTEITFNLKDN